MIKICKQKCENFQGLCSEFFNTSITQQLIDFLPDCDTFQDFNCTNLDFVPPLGLFSSSFSLFFFLKEIVFLSYYNAVTFLLINQENKKTKNQSNN